MLEITRCYTPGMPDCIFCSRPASSLEHVFPQWVLNRKDMGKSRIKLGNRPERIATMHLKVRTICRECNNGWMSDLEDAVRPILIPIFEDKTVFLSQDQQATLGTWVMKIVFLNDTTRGRNEAHRFYTKDETLAFGSSRQLPDFTTIWIGRLTDVRRAITGTQFATTDERGVLTGLATTLTNEHFVAQVLTLKLDPEPEGPATIELKMEPGEWDSVLSRIWHPEHPQINWPTPVSFTSSGPTAYGHLLDRFRIGQKTAAPFP